MIIVRAKEDIKLSVIVINGLSKELESYCIVWFNKTGDTERSCGIRIWLIKRNLDDTQQH